ncbi:hypothetical protein VCR31J2_1280250 [Vibrio coralliirubri]|uniref:Uncharacterized protein n=1 Tax=Vibrio coralliirubri TaxID=1516159 RepID=A0AA86XAA3_9VIBR|nr:hypothetical protein VCR31J2_1280250 [Vibrio coralliirubri]
MNCVYPKARCPPLGEAIEKTTQLEPEFALTLSNHNTIEDQGLAIWELVLASP